jgi:hypothetical protein
MDKSNESNNKREISLSTQSGYSESAQNDDEDWGRNPLPYHQKKKHHFDSSRDWNSDYQALVEEYLRSEKNFKLSNKDDTKVNLKKMRKNLAKLHQLQKQFETHAKDIAKRIVVEQGLGEDLKSIAPTDLMGGFAGGEKYICDGKNFILIIS